MDFLEVLKRRKTTNGPFLPDPVKPEHQRMLVEVAAMAPSHFNSQPWRFVLVDDRRTIDEAARISGESMMRLLEEGTFWKRYRPYFRFSEAEMEEKRDGIHFDQMPAVLKPFSRQIFSNTGQAVMNRFGVPKTLARRSSWPSCSTRPSTVQANSPVSTPSSGWGPPSRTSG
jgi:nitroreductase